MKTILLTSLMFVAGLARAQNANLISAVQVTLPDQSVIQVLGTAFGQTLYTFDVDSATQSNCNGKCAEIWPPITLTPEEVAALAGHPTLGAITRASGLSQLTHMGKPVYLFHLDRVSGDIKGDGVGSVWHLIAL